MQFHYWIVIFLIYSTVIHCCTLRSAKARIINRTGAKIKSLSLVHRYSDVYRNARLFSDIDRNIPTNSYLTVQYRTGFLCYGTDWWWLTWTDSNNKLHIIEPKSSTSCSSDNEVPLVHINNRISKRDSLLVNPTHGNSKDSSICGYHSYMLVNGDNDEFINIILHPYQQQGIEIVSPSGSTTVDYSSSFSK